MDWNLIISIAALVTGGGCVVWIFMAGVWKGEVNTKLDTLIKYTEDNPKEDQIAAVVKQHLSEVKVDLSENSSDVSEIIRNEFNAAINRIHQRLDERATEQQSHSTQQLNLEARLQVLIAGLQAQRADWDILRTDIRSLLHSEATTTNEISNLKSTLGNLLGKIDGALQNIAKLGADVSHLSERKR